MKIRLEYVAQIRDAAGVGGETVDIPAPATVADLFRTVAQTRGERLAGLLLETSGSPRPTVLVFVGDDQVDAETAEPLREGDVVTLMSPLAGG